MPYGTKCGKELTCDKKGSTSSMKNNLKIKYGIHVGNLLNQGKNFGAFKKAKTGHVVSLIIF